MVNKSMEEAIRKAYAKKGDDTSKDHKEPLPASQYLEKSPVKINAAQENEESALFHTEMRDVKPLNHRNTSVPQPSTKTLNNSTKPSPNNPRQRSKDSSNIKLSGIPDSEDLRGLYGTSKPSSTTPLTKDIPPTLTINNDAKPHQFISAEPPECELVSPKHNGISAQFNSSSSSKSVREVVIGLDFGTSSVKAVVGDISTGKAYAVPFVKKDGINGYLLPSRIWQTGDYFSLSAGDKIYRDLKLSILAPGEAPEALERATVFLALIVRHIRGWFFSEHSEDYGNAHISWKLVLGIPVASYPKKNETDDNASLMFKKFLILARAAWLIAGESDNKISLELVKRVRKSVSEGLVKIAPEDIEFDVVPELSAQIYGFLKSRTFDEKAANIFLMVDVGAGTVDTALFHVAKKNGKYEFEYYTNQVKPYGVMNLHRMRVNWWNKELENRPDPAPRMKKILDESFLHTDQMVAIPENLEEYFSGVKLEFVNSDAHPDKKYFNAKLLAQVSSDTVYRAWKLGLLEQAALTKIPMFLCGGGIRMKYFKDLGGAMNSIPGCTWLSCQVKKLVAPKDFEKKILKEGDFDRLSVAYGLSFLDVGKIAKALKLPEKTNAEPCRQCSDNYISKDEM